MKLITASLLGMITLVSTPLFADDSSTSNSSDTMMSTTAKDKDLVKHQLTTKDGKTFDIWISRSDAKKLESLPKDKAVDTSGDTIQ
ncbi:Uncharacterised protein (plasmid) [Legionella adelaidensis]|uniref:Uncharacterized protein n=1 Tax=Legionella adelaidensis TaxID=45056 RepID=A0A0W0R3C9_9GAMM|nr:hypothetical protein [Legionella adelaidensis]KTC65585.1 hypothetical protein Lade_0243 [Legionella adelaidensis]VEH85218.1 Uncharacterised protein [Legionella adelaidensis]